jgi:phosphatidylinositol glycan class B
MLPHAYTLAIAIRSLALFLPHTFFQPDEFFQAFEPAHRLVFGYGHLTWEWLDLPTDGSNGWWTAHIAGGRMRSWLWPGIFASIYRVLQATGQDGSFLLVGCLAASWAEWQAFLPRLVGVLVAASTDYATSILATRLLGHGSAAGAVSCLILSLCSLKAVPLSHLLIQRSSTTAGPVHVSRNSSNDACPGVLSVPASVSSAYGRKRRLARCQRQKTTLGSCRA